MKRDEVLALARRLAKVKADDVPSEWRDFWRDQNARQMAGDLATALVEADNALTLKTAELAGTAVLGEAVKENLQRALKAEERADCLESLVDTLCEKLAALPGLRDEIEGTIGIAFGMGGRCPKCSTGLTVESAKCKACLGTSDVDFGGRIEQATRGVMNAILAVSCPETVRVEQVMVQPRTVPTPEGADHRLRSVICAALLRGPGPLLDLVERVAAAVERRRTMEAHHAPPVPE
jgi:hypothetical protein